MSSLNPVPNLDVPVKPSDSAWLAKGQTTFNEDDLQAVGQTLLESGIIRKIRDMEIDCGTFQLFGSVVLHGGWHAAERFVLPRICGGSGFTRAEARQRAYGEAAERHCAALYNEQDLLFCTYRELPGEGLHPDRFALYRPQNYGLPGFEYQLFTADSPVNWVQGYSLSYQKPVFVPAALVYLPYWPVGGETPIGLLPSTGLSCGRSLSEAAVRGLFEVIERDAIMLMWLNRHAAQRIDPASTGSLRLTALGNNSESTLAIYDITTDIAIPTRFALLTGAYRNRSLVSCGAAVRWEARAAAEKAATEALVVRLAVKKLIESRPVKDFGPAYEQVREVDEHMQLYTDPQMLPALDFLTELEPQPDTVGDLTTGRLGYAEQLRRCLALLAARDLEVVVVDITRPEVAAAGLCVVRVIVPGVIPLSFGARYVCEGPRLWETPKALGYKPLDAAQRQALPPHPFA